MTDSQRSERSNKRDELDAFTRYLSIQIKSHPNGVSASVTLEMTGDYSYPSPVLDDVFVALSAEDAKRMEEWEKLVSEHEDMVGVLRHLFMIVSAGQVIGLERSTSRDAIIFESRIGV